MNRRSILGLPFLLSAAPLAALVHDDLRPLMYTGDNMYGARVQSYRVHIKDALLELTFERAEWGLAWTLQEREAIASIDNYIIRERNGHHMECLAEVSRFSEGAEFHFLLLALKSPLRGVT